MKYLTILLVVMFASNSLGGISPHTKRIREMRKVERKAKGREAAIQSELERGGVGPVAARAIQNMLKKADKKLKRKRIHWDLEHTFMVRYERKLMGLNVRYSELALYELGDFEPMFAWLDNVYRQLEAVLGERVMRGSRLSDLDDLNHAMRVVFDPKDPRWDQAEYKLHFVPFCKIAGYWIVMGACFGFNQFVLTEKLLCQPIALASETTLGLVADPISDIVYPGP